MPLNLAAFARMRQRLLDATAESVTERILAKSNEYIPKDTETAEHSGRVVVDEAAGVVYLTYGKDDDANPKTGEPSNTYIEPLHEDMEQRHAEGTFAKFLQRAVDEMGPGTAEDVARRVRV
jgi:hypothetical protein